MRYKLLGKSGLKVSELCLGAMTFGDDWGWGSTKVEYSLIERACDRELLPMALEMDLAVTVWSPLAGGLLTGKYAEDDNAVKEEKRLEHPMVAPLVDITERKRTISAAVVKVAEAIGKTPAQVALAWLRRQPGVMIPIIGARRLSQLKDNMACVEFTLDEAHLQELNQISRIELGFPHDFFANEMVQNFAYGGMRDLIDNHRAV